VDFDRSNVQYQLQCNQTFFRLDEKRQAVLVNKVLGDIRRIEVDHGADFLLAFRMKAEPRIARAYLEKNPFGVWDSIRKECLGLASKETGRATPVDRILDGFLGMA